VGKTWKRDELLILRLRVYLDQDRQVKPRCDLVVDGCLPVDALAQQILAALATLLA
jgi:hypothetical protein